MEKYEISILKDLTNKIFLSPLIKTSEEGNINILKTSSIENKKIREDKFDLGETEKNIEEYFLKKDDIIFQAKGSRLEAILIEKEYENLISKQSYFNIKVNKFLIDPKYLCWYLNNRVSKQYFKMNSSGAIIKTINRKVLENLKIIKPDLKKQKEISNLISNFYTEKEKTLNYLERKELFINEKIIKSIK